VLFERKVEPSGVGSLFARVKIAGNMPWGRREQSAERKGIEHGSWGIE